MDGKCWGVSCNGRCCKTEEYLTPRSVNWNIELDREWLKNLFVRVGYTTASRHARVRPRSDRLGDLPAASLSLSNAGKSRYREFEVTTRYTFRHDELNASYVRFESHLAI